MEIPVTFYSYFKDLTGVSALRVELPEGATLGDLFEEVSRQHPKMGQARKSCLMAVGLDYERAEYRLKAGDEVSLFPPVQGG